MSTSEPRVNVGLPGDGSVSDTQPNSPAEGERQLPGGGRAVAASGAAAVLAVVASTVAGNLVPLLGAALIAAAAASRRSGWALALARTVIAAFLALSVAPIAGDMLGPLLSPAVLGIVLTVVTAGCTWYATAFRTESSGWAWTALAGPIVLAAAVVVYAIRFGDVPAWAMSGDARNHLLITEHIHSQGSWDFAYPAGYNAVAALLSGPSGGSSPGAFLTAAIQLQAGLVMLLVTLLGVLGGLVAAGSGSGTARQIRTALGSLVSVSPLFLSALLAGGFHPIALAALLVLATTTLVALNPGGIWGCLIWAAAGGVAVLLTYPPAAPVVAGAACAWLAFAWRTSRISLLVGAAGCIAFVLAFWWGVRVLSQQPDIVSMATVDGGIQTRHPLLLGVPVVVAALSWVGFRGRQQVTVLAVVALSTIAAAITVWWLIDLRGAISYYSMKTTWVVASALLPLALTRTVGARYPDRIRSTAAPAGVLAVACCAPVLFTAAEAPVPVLTMARGWTLPSAQAAAVVPWLGDEGRGGLIWSVFDPEEDRRVDIWAAAYSFPEGSIDLNDPAATWAYGNDVAASTPFCTRLAAEPDFVVWTDTEDEATALASVCGGFEDRIGLLPDDVSG